MRYGLVLALLATFGGFVLGGVFGGLEHESHNVLAERAQSVAHRVYHGDAAAVAAGERAAWTFWRRAHLHASAMGTSAMLLILTLAFVPAPAGVRRLSSLGLGAGAVGYACFLLLAGWRAPIIGDAYATKQSVAWLAIPSAGAYLLGTLGAIASIVNPLFAPAHALTPSRTRGRSALREVKPTAPEGGTLGVPALVGGHPPARSRN
jgi:hypothetical protein